MTKLRRTLSRIFSVRHSSVTRRLSNLGSGVGSGRLGSAEGLTSEVVVGVGGGGVFPKTTLNFLDLLQTRPDPTRPRPRSPIFISYPPTRPPLTRPHTGECGRAVLGAFHIGSIRINPELFKVDRERQCTCVPNCTICVSKSITCKPQIYCCSHSPDESLDPITIFYAFTIYGAIFYGAIIIVFDSRCNTNSNSLYLSVPWVQDRGYVAQLGLLCLWKCCG